MFFGSRALKPIQVAPDAKHRPVWEGWGTSLAWFAHALGHDPSTRDIVCQLLFSKEHGLGLNIVRYNIGGANQEHEQEYRPGGAVPCFVRPDGSFDWDADPGQVSMLLVAAQLGADTFEAFVNSPPWFWTVSGSSRGHQHPLRSNLKKHHIQDYAKFCADVVAHFQAAHGITFQSLSPFNEPSSPAWCLAANCKQEACFFSRLRAQKVLRALTEEPGLQQTQLAAFEQFCIRDTLGDLTRLPRELRPAVARVNTHTYNSGVFFSKLRAAPLKPFQDNALARSRLRRLLHKWGDVPLWVSEFGTGRGALQLARHIVKDLATLLPSAWVYWQAVEDLGAGWGLLEMPMRRPEAVSAAGAECRTGGGASGSGSAPAAAAAAAEVMAAAAASGRPEVAVSQAGPSSASLEGSPAPQQQQQQQQAKASSAVLHPNYFVLQFLIQAVPVGSRLCRVKGCGRRAVAVWRPETSIGQGSWSLLYINPSSKPHTFAVTASSFPAVLPAAVTAAAGGSGAGVGQARSHGTAGDGAAQATAAPHQLTKVVVTLLDVAGLQPLKVQGGLSKAQLSAGWQTSSQGVGGSSGCVVEVPAGHLCRVDCH